MPADPRITIASIVGAWPHADSSCSEPITLMSCIVRGDMPGPGWRTIELCTTVSTSARAISGAISGSRMSARISSVRLERAARRARVDADHRLDLRVALEALGEQRAEVAPDAGDQHPAAGHYERLGERLGARLAGSPSSIASRRRPMRRSSALSSRMSS